MKLPALNLPNYEHKIIINDSKYFIYDIFRKKYIVLTPEEWVRQNYLNNLITNKNYPQSRISTEQSLKVNNKLFRCDAIIYGQNLEYLAILECKAPEIKISQKTYEQIGIYNIELNTKNLLISNGQTHLWIKYSNTKESYTVEEKIPEYSEL